MFSQFASSLPDHLHDLSFAPSCIERLFWENQDESMKKIVLDRAENLVMKDMAMLKATDYLHFSRTGNRVLFESIYFERRRDLCACTLAYCLHPENRLLDHIINLVWAICEESSWALPAHNSYIRDTQQLPLADTRRPVIDLFAAESGALLAQVYVLLKPAFELQTPLISSRIETELQTRIYEPYLQEHFWWMGDGDEPMNNWTVWCIQNILLSVFLLPTDQVLRNQVAGKSLYSLDCFVKDYGEDGCCSEGAQYYRHAGLCLYLCMDILNKVTDNLFIELYCETKIKNIASFIRHIHAQGSYYFNFSDCSAQAGACTIREWLFAKAVKDEALAQFASSSAISRAEQQRDLPLEINLTYRLLELIHAKEASETNYTQEDHYYESVGILISRDDHYALAIKAGGNDDSHNHNDTGSIILYKDGNPFLIDLGVESYTKKTFSKDRYTIWTMRSTYHNLTNFPPHEQLAGSEYRSTIKSISLQGNPRIELELADAYPADIGLSSYKRVVEHKKGDGIYLEEMVEEDVSAVLSLMTCSKPVVADGTITLKDIGELKMSGNVQDVKVETISVTDARLKQDWPTVVYRISLSYEAFIHIVIR